MGPHDVFPEQFAPFLVSDPEARVVFLARHADLMDPGFWAGTQARIRAVVQEDVYPYPEKIRFMR